MNNIILKMLSILIFSLPFILIINGFDTMVMWGIPLILGTLTAFFITVILDKYNNDKFVPKIYLITCLFHFLVSIFIQILKYKILNLPVTSYGFAMIGIDNDGQLYHSEAIDMLEHRASGGAYYSYLVFGIYKLLGINEFTVCTINCILSGFIPIIIYRLSKSIIKPRIYIKILSYIVAFSFTIAAYTTVLMRDVYIILFSYLIILSYYKFQKRYDVLNLCLVLLFFLILCFFRPYAAGAVLGACVVSHFVKLAKLKIRKSSISINKYTFLLLGIFVILMSICIYFGSYLRLDYIVSLLDMDTILKVSEEGYGSANSSFGVDRVALSHCPPLFLLFGYACMFFAPFPHQWLLSHNIVQAFSASETIILYIFLIPSFFKGVIKGFKEKNFIIMTSSLYIFFIFTFYGMIIDNSGAVFRGRAPFIALIYMISFFTPHGLLKKLILKYISYKKNLRKL